MLTVVLWILEILVLFVGPIAFLRWVDRRVRVPRVGCATVYVALYVLSFVFAMASLAAPGGGIPFVLPLFLGLPWTLIASALFLVPQVPKEAVKLLMFLVPPMINVGLILFARGTAAKAESFRLVRKPRTTLPEAQRPNDGRPPDADERSGRGRGSGE